MPQSAALNRVIASAVEQGWIYKNYKVPKLRRLCPKNQVLPDNSSEKIEQALKKNSDYF
jgi:hypothetical protein